MSVRRHLCLCQRNGRCSTCFFHCIKFTIRCINSHRHTPRSPGNPCTAKVSRRVGILYAHIDTAYRIHLAHKRFDIIFQKFSIHPDIPIFCNLESLIHFRYLTHCYTLATLLKIHDNSSRRNNVLDGNGGKGIRQGVFDIIGSLCGNHTAAKRKCRTGAKSGTGIRPRSIRCFLIVGGTGDGVFATAGSVGIRNQTPDIGAVIINRPIA